MLRAAQSDALRAKVAGDTGVMPGVGVGPHAQPANLIGSAHEGLVTVAQLRLFGLDLPQQHGTGGAINGCDLRCAARATEQHSGKPSASVVVTDMVTECGLEKVSGLRRLNEAGQQAVAETAVRVADLVDTLLDKKWSRREWRFIESEAITLDVQQPKGASCSCGSGIPVQTVQVNGEAVTLIALPALFEQFQQAGNQPSTETTAELLAQVKIYNDVPAADEAAYRETLAREYALFCGEEAVMA